MPADAFALLDRVLSRYRSDVHQLEAGATPDSLQALEAHLGRELPRGLHAFLARHNGGSLFRGSLRLRSTKDMALASAEVAEVVLFADDNDGTRWGWASDGHGGFVFGTWDGARLRAHHGRFAGWLAGSLALVETRVRSPEDRAALRLEADPDDLYQLLDAGERALRAGDPDRAEQHLRRATALSEDQVAAWQLLGDALSVSDRAAARYAWLQAFRNARLPVAWPGAPCFNPDTLRPLSASFGDPEDWEHELQRFGEEQVADVRSAEELEVVVKVAGALAASRMARGRRSQARDALAHLLQRCRTFSWGQTPWASLLQLASLEADLGNHDECEALLRRLRNEGPAELQGPGLLLLARLATTRQEPWAEDILTEAEAARLDEADSVRAVALRIERAVRQERLDGVELLLERARQLSRRVAMRPLQALVGLTEGEVLRARGDLGGAREAWAQALNTLDGGRRHDHELRCRLVLRLGDAALERGRRDEAMRHYQEAARGFARHELPVREGWALLRLARLGADPALLLKAARSRFERADLAAGIAAVDAVTGRPWASLEWHLERATAQARARHDAQRSRPPWTRADADRPERRLGAHRLAIAACDEQVVAAIGAEMDAAVRSMATGRLRPLDPPVLKYMAAVDLLAGHRSFAAAKKLLSHLLSTSVEGPARRALQGAMARSPNAALVDGLLSTIESPTDHLPHAVAAAAEVLGLRREAESTAALVALLAPEHGPTVRKSVIPALGRIGHRGVVDRLAPCLEEPGLAEATALALLMLGDSRGIDFHARALAEGRKDLTGGSPGEIVGRYGGPSYLILLKSAAQGGDDRSLGALQGLGLMGDPRALPVLVAALSHRDHRVVEVASGALSILTGVQEDADDPGVRSRWQRWVDTEGERMAEGVRHRDGTLFTPGLLLAKMDHPDAWVRRTAYDELVIATGTTLPFDAEGPWRVQRTHLATWERWWRQHKSSFVPGSWTMDGQRVG